MLAEHLAGYFVDFGEQVTIDGQAVTCIFDGGYSETLGAAGTLPSLLCVAAEVPTVAVGDAVVRGSAAYKVRNVLPSAPDEAFTRLVLEAQ